MCGRTSLAVPLDVLRDRFEIDTATRAVESYIPTYNVDPSDGLVTLTNEEPSSADVFEWGFVPEWADDPADVPNPINTRVESAEDSGMFRSAFQNRRCLLLADGFYEWEGQRGSKQPYRIRRTDEEPFAFAGIWSRWEGDGEERLTASILTTESNDVVEPISTASGGAVTSGVGTAWRSIAERTVGAVASERTVGRARATAVALAVRVSPPRSA